eukprot:843207_1
MDIFAVCNLDLVVCGMSYDGHRPRFGAMDEFAFWHGFYGKRPHEVHGAFMVLPHRVYLEQNTAVWYVNINILIYSCYLTIITHKNTVSTARLESTAPFHVRGHERISLHMHRRIHHMIFGHLVLDPVDLH